MPRGVRKIGLLLLVEASREKPRFFDAGKWAK
jgi:hypothetical protein